MKLFKSIIKNRSYLLGGIVLVTASALTMSCEHDRSSESIVSKEKFIPKKKEIKTPLSNVKTWEGETYTSAAFSLMASVGNYKNIHVKIQCTHGDAIFYIRKLINGSEDGDTAKYVLEEGKTIEYDVVVPNSKSRIEFKGEMHEANGNDISISRNLGIGGAKSTNSMNSAKGLITITSTK
ncbi:hypothetical protein [Elizabethkingia ursingii]|uniref:Lipoprotein n=1 Tax=Elizabethkingia ursingii TaxID=1756150 RepID=A0ABX3N8A3_9FLAO|nr:hypothetical protein [Elizabethkingia ursingii]OPB88509.1 hypothetical protein BB021_08140 [Elizabethkingia ursingii]